MTDSPAPFLTAKLVITESQFQDILFAATLSGIIAGEMMNRQVVLSFMAATLKQCPQMVNDPATRLFLQSLKDSQSENDLPGMVQDFINRKDENPVFSPEYRAMSKEIVPGFFELNSEIDFMAIWTEKMLEQFKGGPRG